MKKIRDERLVLKNLQNIRIAFAFQTIGIIVILAYDGISNGFNQVTNNPLWLLFMGTAIIQAYMSLGISIDTEESNKGIRPLPPYYKVILTSLSVGVLIGLIVLFTSESTLRDAFIIGGVLFLCCLAPYSIVYYLRKRRLQRDDE